MWLEIRPTMSILKSFCTSVSSKHHTLSKAYSSACWSKDAVALKNTTATSPAQILGPLSLFCDTHLYRVKSPELLLSEQIEATIWTRHRPIGALWYTSPVCQSTGVVGLLMQGIEIKNRVAGAFKQDHVTQWGIVESTVRVAR